MKSRNLMMGVFIAVVMQGIARAQPADLTRTVTLKPSTDYNERNDNWPFKLAPTQTATYNVTIQGQDIVGGVLYKLKEPLSPPNFTPAYNNPGFLWAWKQTGGTATSQTRQFKVVNTVWEEKTATVVVKCTWKPVGTGSAGCTASVPSPDLDGEAKGTARHQVGRLVPTSDLDVDGAPDYLCINEEITLQSWLVTDTLPDLDPFLVESSWSVAGIGTSPGAGTIAPSPEDTVTFTPSSAGRVKVTATYTGDGNHSDTVEFTILSVESECLAAGPLPKTRRKIGVCEKVKLTLKPSGLSPITWSKTGDGTLSDTTGSTVTFTAHDRASTPSVTASYSGHSCTVNFTVVQPDGVYQEKSGNTWHQHNFASAGFRGVSYLTPKDVSFENIEINEGTVNAVATGSMSDADGSAHDPWDNWAPVSTGNAAKGCMVEGPNLISGVYFDAVWTRTGVAGGPWNAGTFEWKDIPWEFRKPGGTKKVFSTLTHRAEVEDGTGKMIVSKGGVTVSAMPADPTENW